MTNRISAFDALLLLLVTFTWGSNFVVMKLGLNEFSPLTITFLRFAFSALPWVFFISRPQLSLRWVALNGLLLGCGQFGCLFMALRGDITPGLASLLMQIHVFLTIVASAFLFKEAVKFRQVLGLATAALGLLLVGWHIGGELTWRGLVLTLSATGFWALSNLLIKSVTKDLPYKINMLSFIVWSSLFAVLPLACMAIAADGFAVVLQQIQSATWLGWSAVVWQAVGNMLMGFGLWSMLLAKYPASVVTPWALLVPVFGMTSSSLYFGEAFPAWKFAVFALVMGGVALVTWPARATAKAAA